MVAMVVQCSVINVHERVKYGNIHSYNIISEKYVCSVSFFDKVFFA
jgi:hypothetical protein